MHDRRREEDDDNAGEKKEKDPTLNDETKDGPRVDDKQKNSSDDPQAQRLSSPTSDDTNNDTNVGQDSQDDTSKDPYYSVYTKTEKWLVVIAIAIAGLFSPLTANIYFPAIPAISDAFHKSVELINLSVTVYMIFQGVAPMFWGTLSDYKGRRPVYMMCLLTLSLSCVGLALIPTSAYWLLMLLRCLQAIGSASTIALGAGVIGDITRPEERGGMYGVYGVGPLIGPAIGPVIGGVISEKLGWRAIFWFLCIASGVCLIFLFLFLPETLRALVGDGSLMPSRIYRPIIPIIGRSRRGSAQPTKPAPKAWVNPFTLLKNPDIVMLLLVNGIGTGVFYVVATSLSTLFAVTYPQLSVAEIGYCFLALGGAMTIGTAVSGRMLDVEYRSRKRKLLRATGEDPEKQVDAKAQGGLPLSFPIEKARLGSTPIIMLVFAAATAGYGWTIKPGLSLAAPLILQIVIGFTTIWVLTATQTLLIDLVPDRGSSVTACNNLVRCTTGAVMVSVINPILDGLGAGWTFVIFAATGVIGTGLLLLAMKIGPGCRAKRRQAEEKQKKEKEAAGAGK